MIDLIFATDIINNLVINGVLSGVTLTFIISLFAFLIFKLWGLFKSLTR